VQRARARVRVARSAAHARALGCRRAARLGARGARARRLRRGLRPVAQLRRGVHLGRHPLAVRSRHQRGDGYAVSLGLSWDSATRSSTSTGSTCRAKRAW
jgi:hypothetical protein